MEWCHYHYCCGLVRTLDDAHTTWEEDYINSKRMHWTPLIVPPSCTISAPRWCSCLIFHGVARWISLSLLLPYFHFPREEVFHIPIERVGKRGIKGISYILYPQQQESNFSEERGRGLLAVSPCASRWVSRSRGICHSLLCAQWVVSKIHTLPTHPQKRTANGKRQASISLWARHCMAVLLFIILSQL